MDKTVLVDSDIEAGRELIASLRNMGVAVKGAAWLQLQNHGLWHLYVVSPDVVERGPLFVYGKIQQALARGDIPLRLQHVVAANTTNSFANALLKVVRVGPGANHARTGRMGVGEFEIIDAVVYRLGRASQSVAQGVARRRKRA